MLARRAGRVISALLIAAGLLFGLFLIAPALMGWERYVIVSGSMTGTYDRGSLVLDEVVPVADLKVGDVITYRPPRGSGPKGLVTHRIAAIGHDPKGGQRVFRTKGDANKVRDPWTFTLPNRTQARVTAGVPYITFGTLASGTPRTGVTTAVNMTWTSSNAARDVAGNNATGNSVTESGAVDRDF